MTENQLNGWIEGVFVEITTYEDNVPEGVKKYELLWTQINKHPHHKCAEISNKTKIKFDSTSTVSFQAQHFMY